MKRFVQYELGLEVSGFESQAISNSSKSIFKIMKQYVLFCLDLLKEVLTNAWVVGVGAAVLAGLILYHLFGVGKKGSPDKKEESFTFKVAEEKVAFEEKMRSLRMDVVKINAHDHAVGVAAEYAWIRENYPGSKKHSQTLLEQKFKRKNGAEKSVLFDLIRIELENGRKKEVYFDVSSFFSDGNPTSFDSDYAKHKIREIYS